MAIPKLALIPSTVGGSVYSVLPSNGDGDFDFTRASAATRINAQGLIENVAVGDNRLNYPLIDGVVQGCPSLLLEPQRTNLIQYSEDFSNAYWTKSGASVTSGFTSPKGDLSAFKLVEDTSTGDHFIQAAGITTIVDKYSFTLFAKSSESSKLRVRGANYFSNVTGADFDLIAKTATNLSSSVNASIIEMSDGWFKCTFTTLSNAFAGGNAHYRVYLLDDLGATSYTGDGTSGVYIWGAQFELGSYPTSYIPSLTGSQTTRSAETCNNAGDVNTFNDSEGVLFAEIASLDNSTVEQISISDGSTDNRVYFTKTGIANEFRFAVVDGGSTQASITKAVNDNTSMHKIAGKYKANDVAFWINGFEVGTDTSATMPSGLDELAFDSGSGSLDFYANIKQIQYFDSALTDSDLETLTSWVSFSDMAIGQLYTIE